MDNKSVSSKGSKRSASQETTKKSSKKQKVSKNNPRSKKRGNPKGGRVSTANGLRSIVDKSSVPAYSALVSKSLLVRMAISPLTVGLSLDLTPLFGCLTKLWSMAIERESSLKTYLPLKLWLYGIAHVIHTRLCIVSGKIGKTIPRKCFAPLHILDATLPTIVSDFVQSLGIYESRLTNTRYYYELPRIQDRPSEYYFDFVKLYNDAGNECTVDFVRQELQRMGLGASGDEKMEFDQQSENVQAEIPSSPPERKRNESASSYAERTKNWAVKFAQYTINLRTKDLHSTGVFVRPQDEVKVTKPTSLADAVGPMRFSTQLWDLFLNGMRKYKSLGFKVSKIVQGSLSTSSWMLHQFESGKVTFVQVNVAARDATHAFVWPITSHLSNLSGMSTAYILRDGMSVARLRTSYFDSSL